MSFRLHSSMKQLSRRHWALIGGGLLLIGLFIGLWLLNRAEPLPAANEVAERMAARLSEVRTVQGEIQLVHGEVATEQELWVESPRRLRTEIEAGPPILAPKGANHKTTLVLNENQAWFYNPNLNLTTVADRSSYQPEAGLDVGGSILESLPQAVLDALQASPDVQIVGEEEIADRPAIRVQIFLPNAENLFKARRLSVSLDRQFYYPLLVESDSGFAVRFRTVSFNQAIDPATFVFAPPPGSTVNEVRQ